MPPLVCAHRCRLEGSTHPENSLAALEETLAAGIPMAELDANLTADGALVAYHDRLAPDGRPLSELSRAELAAQVADLADVSELLACLAGRAVVNIDLKAYDAESCLEDALTLLEPECFVVSGLDPVWLAAVRQRFPQARVGLSVGARSWTAARAVARARSVAADLLSADWRLLRTGLAGRARRAYLPLYVWTVNDERLLRRLLRDERLSGVMTDRPLRALELQRG